ncbi:MlaD family protein [Williamsia sp.]|uniref:MlaD family protein n=1 Tax=Williamsia sp. TaxID=1872085 RepID=UPI002F91D0A0
MTTNPREPSAAKLRVRGLIAVALAVGLIVLLVVQPFSKSDEMVKFSIVAPSLPDGIQNGLPVDVRGETVGSVCGIDISHRDTTTVDVCVTKSQAGELTQDAAVSFVSRNLFGSDALRLVPTGRGTHVSQGSVITLSQAPSDYTVTATVRSAGAFTIPVLTPELSRLLHQVSDTTVRLAPFLTSATIALQTLERGQTARLSTLLPTAADAVSGIGSAGAGGVSALQIVLTNPLLADEGYTNRVSSMIGDIGSLFTGLGTLFNGISGLGATLDLVNAFTTPLTGALSGVTAAQLGELIDHAGGAFQTDPKTGKTVLSVEANLDIVPGVSTPLGRLLAGTEEGS